MESKLEKMENWKIAKTDEEMWSQSQERLCKSIMKGLARRNRERHAMLADVEEEQDKTSYVLTTSPARNCRGMQCAKLVNWN